MHNLQESVASTIVVYDTMTHTKLQYFVGEIAVTTSPNSQDMVGATRTTQPTIFKV